MCCSHLHMLVIVGGVHISIALAKLAKVLGYRTVIIDPRRAFGSAERFPHADQLIQAWPDEALSSLAISRSTAIAVLTHDPKLDDPALLAALPGPAYYVGALGSKTTQAKRRHRLLEAGLSETQVDRLHGPIGLNLGAHSPEEIALSILAEIVAYPSEAAAWTKPASRLEPTTAAEHLRGGGARHSGPCTGEGAALRAGNRSGDPGHDVGRLEGAALRAGEGVTSTLSGPTLRLRWGDGGVQRDRCDARRCS